MTPEYRVVAEGLRFPEGPLELPNGDILITEIEAGRLTKIRQDGSKEIFAVTGGGPNGAAIGPDEAIYVTQNGGFEWSESLQTDGTNILRPGDRANDYTNGSIQRVSAEGNSVETLYDNCNGEPLKGPNDLVFDHEGNFYFTDLGKRYGRQRDITGLYYASPDGKFIKEIVFPFESPNGIGLSPDEKTLYVAETPSGRLWAFDIVSPGEVKNRRVLGHAPPAEGINQAMFDSLCVDSEGNIIIATILNGGITSISPDGKHTTHISLPDGITTNPCFAGPELRTLYVTLGSTGRLIAFDNWPTQGLKLAFQKGVTT